MNAHISLVGGDNSRVTVGAERRGADITSLHLSSSSSPLFQRMMLMVRTPSSPSSQSPLPPSVTELSDDPMCRQLTLSWTRPCLLHSSAVGSCCSCRAVLSSLHHCFRLPPSPDSRRSIWPESSTVTSLTLTRWPPASERRPFTRLTLLRRR